MIRNIIAELKPIYEVSIEEAKQFINWVYRLRNITQFNPVVMTHPRMCMATASDENGPILYLPFQSCIMFDSMAPRPDATKREISYALFKIGQMTEQVMKQTGNCDAYFYTLSDELGDSVIKHGWEELKDVRLFRRRIPVKEQK